LLELAYRAVIKMKIKVKADTAAGEPDFGNMITVFSW
jgi:hypothetical protein